MKTDPAAAAAVVAEVPDSDRRSTGIPATSRSAASSRTIGSGNPEA